MKKGFTLMELIISIAIIGIISGVVLVGINPAKRIGQSRDAKRWSDVVSILNAVLKYQVDNRNYPSGITTTAQVLGTATGDANCVCSGGTGTEDCLDLSSDLVDDYLAEIPCDENSSNSTCTGSTITRYSVSRTASGRITVEACDPYEGSISTTK